MATSPDWMFAMTDVEWDAWETAIPRQLPAGREDVAFEIVALQNGMAKMRAYSSKLRKRQQLLIAQMLQWMDDEDVDEMPLDGETVLRRETKTGKRKAKPEEAVQLIEERFGMILPDQHRLHELVAVCQATVPAEAKVVAKLSKS